MKNSIIFIIMSIFSTACFATSINKNIGCLLVKDNACTLTVSVHEREVSGNKVNLYKDDFIEQDLLTLKKYYDLAKQNNMNEIKALFSKKDGSYDLISQEIKENPSKYARFHKVGDIKINNIYLYADYSIFYLSWFDKNGKKIADWSEAVQCYDGKCFMSDRILKRQANFDLLFDIINAKTIEATMEVNDSFSIFKSSIETDFPLEVSIKFKGLTDHDLKSDALSVVSEFLTSLKVNYDTYRDNMSEGKKSKKYLQSIYLKYWEKITDSDRIPFPKRDRKDATSIYHVGSSMAGIANYVYQASSFISLGVIESDLYTFVMLKNPDSGFNTVITLVVNNQSNKLVSSTDQPINVQRVLSILSNSIIYPELNAKYSQVSEGESLLKNDSLNYKVAFNMTKDESPANQDYALYALAILMILMVLMVSIWLVRRK